MMKRKALTLGLGLALLCGAPASALTFTENFSTDAANWTDGPGNGDAGNPTFNWIDGVGSDGDGYLETLAGAINDPGTILFRATGANGASGGGFTGDWIAGNVTRLSAFVRHDFTVPGVGSPVPVNFFFRIATGGNFPAAVGIVPIPVLPSAGWTEIAMDIDPTNPLLVIEGAPAFDFDDVFSNVGNVQVGASVPVAFENVPFTSNVDEVSIVPEPSTGLLLGLGVLTLGLGRRRACA